MKKRSLPLPSGKEELILSLLLRRPGRYGLELVEASDGELSRGTVYVTLGRMQEKGFVESIKEHKREGARGLPRRLYKITGLGEQALAAKLAGLDAAFGILVGAT